jgi:sulfur-oxidizing protein SoxZ
MAALVKMPQRARAGEVIEISVMAAHPMETGFKPGPDGRLIPRNIIHTFTCSDAGVEVFRVDLSPAITADPYLAFTTVATRTGTLEFRWTDDRGEIIVEQRQLIVE